MARRGTPLAGNVREAIRELVEKSPDPMSFRSVARKLGLSGHTAKKYWPRSLRTSLEHGTA